MNSSIRLIFFFTLPFLVPTSLTAQKANFDAYKAQYDQGAGNTIFDKGLKQTAPVSGYPFVLITGVKFKDCANGVPTENELSHLYTISDSVYATVTTLVKNIMAGTFTYQCERLEYYYVTDTTNIREHLTKLYQKHFSAYDPYINIKPDKDWDAYLKFLYPNEETLEYMQNEKILMTLEKQGDKLEKERRVNHWINFTSEKDIDCFIPYATKQGFKVETKGKDTKSELLKLRISRTDKVDLPSISSITSALRKEAKKCNGIYNGWETAVVK
ncbi:DUF695 domain-containing protein [Chitinophaga ginsengisoli]|uniref:Uncharacterized protein DUF695 n=1 Tax=Chitinophaga ginsengisoli TaxID=363837 RepID=A0A2P8G743_9BACT|nr:DUF695 domain-containing protein [Chitinophaga ginsengisoli]PSL29767.1 uncharacterized protein DUF695 [Chitinophaga ginsengisoli]